MFRSHARVSVVVACGLLLSAILVTATARDTDRTQTPAATQTAPSTSGAASDQSAAAAQPQPLTTREKDAQLYQKYCAACHGVNGEGHIADHANSLRSPSFLSTVNDNILAYSIRYGRAGTAMAGYSTNVGGPLTDREIRGIMRHIRRFSDVATAPATSRPDGDPARGAKVYEQHCQTCHGPSGRGPTAPSLNDPLFLLLTGPEYLRHAISEGREQTNMVAFKSTLTPEQIDDVVAHVRSWRTQWVVPEPRRLMTMHLGEGVLNPSGQPPHFAALREDRYVAPLALREALDGKARLLLMDARPTSQWGESHIPGAVPFPYYDIVPKVGELPTDGTWIVVYCACPTALANTVVDALRTRGFKNTAVLDEGFGGWIGRGYPLQSGTVPADAPSHP